MSPISQLEELTPCKHYKNNQDRIDYLENNLIPSLKQYHEKCGKTKKPLVIRRIEILSMVLDKLLCL
jgi:hypothetical protein